jgi:vitamin B12 transport system substrate-binding protein
MTATRATTSMPASTARKEGRLRKVVSCLTLALSFAGPAWAEMAYAEPVRVVTLAPHITELMFAAGADGLLVATVTSSTFPEQAKSLPRVGDGLNVNSELLLSLQPTHVLSWQQGGAALVLAPLLQNLGITLDYIEPRKVGQIADHIMALGERFGTQETAANSAAQLRKTLAGLGSHYEHAKPVSVLIEIGQNPPYTLGNDPLTNDALTYCAAHNMYAHATPVAPQIQQEFVLAHQPDMILVPSTNPEVIPHIRERWATLGLQAAMRGHVYWVNRFVL